MCLHSTCFTCMQVLRLSDDRVRCAPLCTGTNLVSVLRLHLICISLVQRMTANVRTISPPCLQTKDVEVNFEQMFLNTVEGLEAGGAKLQHVQFVSGEACCLYDGLYKTCTAMMALIAAPLLSECTLVCNICRDQMVRCMTCNLMHAPLVAACGSVHMSHHQQSDTCLLSA